jgi:hypothetical protein
MASQAVEPTVVERPLPIGAERVATRDWIEVTEERLVVVQV